MIKTEESAKTVKVLGFPKLVKFRGTGNVYLMHDKSSGVCIRSEDQIAEVGSHYNVLCDNYNDYQGSITLENTFD